jgi:hypothetical protein
LLGKKKDMKKYLFIFMAVACFAACKQRDSAAAGEMKLDPMTDTANFTTIQWLDSNYLDLGTVKEGPEVEVAFRFKNAGDKKLIIQNVSASCGCTVPETPKEPFEPGKTGTIRAKFNSKGHVGNNNKTISVSANTTGSTTTVLQFHIMVEKGE